MSGVIGYSEIGQGRAIAVDNDAGLFLIESDHRNTKIGMAGEGPCEIRQVSSFAVVQDTLFVLDNRQGRIIGYSISTGACVDEVTDSDLTDVSSLSSVNGSYYLVSAKYTSMTPPDWPLLFRMGAGGGLEPLDLAVEDLEADRLLVSVTIGRRTSQIRVKDGELFFLLPFSHRVWKYDTRTLEVSSIELAHDSGDISGYAQSADPNDISEAISRLESEWDLF